MLRECFKQHNNKNPKKNAWNSCDDCDANLPDGKMIREQWRYCLQCGCVSNKIFIWNIWMADANTFLNRKTNNKNNTLVNKQKQMNHKIRIRLSWTHFDCAQVTKEYLYLYLFMNMIWYKYILYVVIDCKMSINKKCTSVGIIVKQKPSKHHEIFKIYFNGTTTTTNYSHRKNNLWNVLFLTNKCDEPAEISLSVWNQ